MNARWIAAVTLGLGVAAITIGCDDVTEGCSPDDHNLGAAKRLTPRALKSPPIQSTTACTNPRLIVISSELELTQLNSELGLSGAGESDKVDFTREHVIVREGPANESMSWTVAQGGTGIVGLVSCFGAVPTASCAVNIVAVPALIDRVESRKCDPVRCGAAPSR